MNVDREKNLTDKEKDCKISGVIRKIKSHELFNKSVLVNVIRYYGNISIIRYGLQNISKV